MELSLLHQKPTFIHHSLTSIFSTGKRPFNRNTSILSCHCSSSSSDATAKLPSLSSQCEGRRALMGCLLAAGTRYGSDEEEEIFRLRCRIRELQEEEGHLEAESFHGLDSKSLASVEDDEQDVLTGTRHGSDEEEEIFRLRCRIRELQEKEGHLEARFLQYCNTKEEESILMGLQSNLLLEIARVEFLGREASSMESESRRLEELAVEYLKILEQLGAARSEKRLLHRKVKKLRRKTRGMSCVIRQKNMQIEAGEAELMRNQKEGERKDNVIREMEDQIVELQSVIDQLQREKNELQNKLQLAENSASSQIEAKEEEDYNELVKELERVKKDQSVEAEELVFLRWCSACLRHQLMKKNQEEEEEEEETEERNPNPNPQFDLGAHHEQEHEHDHDHSKRPKLIQKLKRWVEGCEKMKQKLDGNQKHGGKCLRGSSVSDGTEDHHLLPPGNSCSSA